MLLDFLHLSRNRYVYFGNRASKVGMVHWTWWILSLALQVWLYRALHPKWYATHNLCIHDFLKLHHNCDAYMGVQKQRKSMFLTAFKHQEKEARSFKNPGPGFWSKGARTPWSPFDAHDPNYNPNPQCQPNANTNLMLTPKPNPKS